MVNSLGNALWCGIVYIVTLASLCEMRSVCDDCILCVTCKVCVVSIASHTGTICIKNISVEKMERKYDRFNLILSQSVMEFSVLCQYSVLKLYRLTTNNDL